MDNLPDYKEHIVAYIDLLGFKESVYDGDRKIDILKLLDEFAKHVGGYKYKEEILDQSSKRRTLRPEISIFSDNIVMSYPMDGLSTSPDLIIESFLEYIVWFATHALYKGFLLRGGIVKGKLYHQSSKNIVFGEGLIDAYHLESTMAIYPRVLISTELYNSISNNHFFIEDFDGLPMLNYINSPIHSILQMGIPSGNNFFNSIDDRINLFDKIITDNIDKLNDNPKAKRNWLWFQKYYLGIRESNLRRINTAKNAYKKARCTSNNDIELIRLEVGFQLPRTSLLQFQAEMRKNLYNLLKQRVYFLPLEWDKTVPMLKPMGVDLTPFVELIVGDYVFVISPSSIVIKNLDNVYIDIIKFIDTVKKFLEFLLNYQHMHVNMLDLRYTKSFSNNIFADGNIDLIIADKKCITIDSSTINYGVKKEDINCFININKHRDTIYHVMINAVNQNVKNSNQVVDVFEECHTLIMNSFNSFIA